MNEQQFLERAHANPNDDAPDFLDALAGNPQREALVADLKALDSRLKAGLETINAPDHLKQALLEIPENEHPGTVGEAANDPWWRRNVQYAAALVVAVGVLAIVMQTRGIPLEDMIFRHLYSELSFLEEDSPMGLAQVNQVMGSSIGSRFTESGDMQKVSINFTKDCWVDYDKGIRGVHLVMKGDVGPVTVMVIPNSPIPEERAIHDDHFYGLITPTSGGNIVVIGEKDEPIANYSTVLASNISW